MSKLIKGVNDLLTINPNLAKQWHPTKNGNLTPDMFTVNSHQTIIWQCDLNHDWPATIKNRNLLNRGCPYCSNQKVLPGFNDLATTHPQLAAEWDYENNTENPSNIIGGKSTKYFWICANNHSYPSTVNHRKRGGGCPYCANKKLLIGFNDLATTHPQLAAA